MGLVIEVGVNRGTDTQKLLKKYPNSNYIGFEPVPELYKQVLPLIVNTDPRFYRMLYNMAVSDFDGEAKFYITATDPKIKAKYGASSLYEFDDDLKNKWDRADFIMAKTIKIPCTRLDTFLELQSFHYTGALIDYLHCDAQGSDFRVLKGLGNYIQDVKAGVVEATRKIPLYKDHENNEEHIIQWLESRDFNITSVKPNDRFEAEVNIHFEKK